MQSIYVIEADDKMMSLFVFKVTKKYTPDGIVYVREGDPEKAVLQDFSCPKFYGQLDSLLITESKLKDAEPIEIAR